jgi:hypothetical protein
MQSLVAQEAKNDSRTSKSYTEARHRLALAIDLSRETRMLRFLNAAQASPFAMAKLHAALLMG